jgi:hypothetical protein
MNLPIRWRSTRPWAIALCAVYVVALVPGSVLAGIGMRWLDGSGRGWRTGAAAAALVTAWFPLALGAAFAWKAAWARSSLNLLAGAAFGLIAMACYAVFLAWGGHMLM